MTQRLYLDSEGDLTDATSVHISAGFAVCRGMSARPGPARVPCG